MNRILALAVVLCFGSASIAADPPKMKLLADNPASVVLATTIDFGNELGLDFASLKALGGRIEQARTASDPVCLAVCAAELAAAEKASGKMAKIKAADLLKEATGLAVRRFDAAELTAVAALTTDEAAKKALTDKSAEAKKTAGEVKKGIGGELLVLNNSDRTLAIYINGQYVGNVRSNNEATFFVGANPGDSTEILARSGKFKWGPRVVERDVNNYKWTLNPLNPSKSSN